MKTLFATLALLAGLSTVALADDAAEADADNACAAEQHEDGEKAACDCGAECHEKADKEACDCGCGDKKDDETEEEKPAEEEKGGKAMKKSNDGNMESYDEDE